jgi:hypothetical protein
LAVVLHRYETSYVTLKELNRLRILKHRLHKAEAVTGDRKILHNDELHDLYSIPDIIRMIGQGG